jgi:hypothetical protein
VLDGISTLLAHVVYPFQLAVLHVLQINIGMEIHVLLKLWVMSVSPISDGMEIVVFNILLPQFVTLDTILMEEIVLQLLLKLHHLLNVQ